MMSVIRERPTESSRTPAAIDLLYSIIRDPDTVEPGLRLLAMDHEGVPGACLACGLDRSKRWVVLYVTPGVVDEPALSDALASMAAAVSRTSAESGGLPKEGLAGPGARILVVAAGFGSALLRGPPRLGYGELELLRWSAGAEPVGENPGEEWRDARVADAGSEVDPPHLTPEEIDSLVGSWPVGAAESRL